MSAELIDEVLKFLRDENGAWHTEPQDECPMCLLIKKLEAARVALG